MSNLRLLLALTIGLGCGGDTDSPAGPDASESADAGADAEPAAGPQLTGLTVEGFALEPEFDPTITEYYAAGPFYRPATNVVAEAAPGDTISFEGATVASGEPNPVELVVGTPTGYQVTVSRDGQSTDYTVTVARGRGAIEFLAGVESTEASDFFSRFSIDGDTLAVGAPGEDGGSTGLNGDENDNTVLESGAVYVLSRAEDNRWDKDVYIKAPVVEEGDRFGAHVVLQGDTLAIGVQDDDGALGGANADPANNDGNNTGAIWIYANVDGTWAPQAFIKPSEVQDNLRFGARFALDGDTLVVGSAFYQDAAGARGAVWIFRRNGTVWTQEALIQGSDNNGISGFGFGYDVSGDTVVIGSHGDDSDATGVDGDETNNNSIASGAAHVYVRDGGAWTRQAYLKASNTQPDALFGYKISVSGDTVAIGSTKENGGGTGVEADQTPDPALTDSGAVYVFTRSGEQWAQQAYIKAPSTDRNDYFGFQIELTGDVLAVSSRYEDSAALGFDGDPQNNDQPNAGAVFMLERTGESWAHTTYVKTAEAVESGWFGDSISISGGTAAIRGRLGMYIVE